jgi:hypothetical protein
MKTKEPKSDWDKIESLLMAFESIHWHGVMSRSGHKATGDLWGDVQAIAGAMEAGEYDLLVRAVEYLKEGHTPGEETEGKLAHDTKFMAYNLSAQTSMAKSDILRFIENRYPEHFGTIPTSKRGLTHWWASVGGMAKQARGYMSKEVRDMLGE